MRIGELARQTATEAVTIRFYEKKGLMPTPERTEGNYRRYSEAHRERLLFIRHCRAMNMTLEEIRVLLACRDEPTASCEAVNRTIDRHIAQVQAQIEELRTLEQQLQSLSRQCTHHRNPNGRAAACGILQSLNACEAGIGCRGHRPSDDHPAS